MPRRARRGERKAATDKFHRQIYELFMKAEGKIYGPEAEAFDDYWIGVLRRKARQE